jgi:hypothetical protein
VREVERDHLPSCGTFQRWRRQKISIKYLFMQEGIGRWLVAEFPIRAIHLQNWMVVAAGIVLLWIVYLWLGGWLRRQD